MKKFLPLLILVPYLFIAGKSAKSRFETTDDMCKALLMAFQNDDSLRYLELIPAKEEANMVYVVPFAGNDQVQQRQKNSINEYFDGNGAIPRQQFRRYYQQGIKEKIDWKKVVFVKSSSELQHNAPKGIDYLYRVLSEWNLDGRIISVKLQEAMKTSAGWNCGMRLSLKIDPTPQELAERYDRMRADSTRMADSVYAVDRMMQMKADSAHIADSLAMVEAMKKAKKNPK